MTKRKIKFTPSVVKKLKNIIEKKLRKKGYNVKILCINKLYVIFRATKKGRLIYGIVPVALSNEDEKEYKKVLSQIEKELLANHVKYAKILLKKKVCVRKNKTIKCYYVKRPPGLKIYVQNNEKIILSILKKYMSKGKNKLNNVAKILVIGGILGSSLLLLKND